MVDGNADLGRLPPLPEQRYFVEGQRLFFLTGGDSGAYICSG